MGQIYLIRHGQASFGSANYDELSALGREQGRLLGKWFAQRGQDFHRIVTGNLKRHRQTADACLSAMPVGPTMPDWETDAGFNEYDHHDLLTRHHPEFGDPAAVTRFFSQNDNPHHAYQQIFQGAMARWMSGRHDGDYREPWPVFRQRCVSALQRLQDGAGRSQSIAVFTSGGTIATLCQHLLGFPDRKMAELNWALVNSAVTRILYRPGAMSLSYINNFAHLEALGTAQSITYR